jgi:hypothetical protein
MSSNAPIPTTTLAICQTELLEVTQIFRLELRPYSQIMAESYKLVVLECFVLRMCEVRQFEHAVNKSKLMLVGNLKSLNDLAKQARADHIIHTGDFGFYDETSLDRIAEK